MSTVDRQMAQPVAKQCNQMYFNNISLANNEHCVNKCNHVSKQVKNERYLVINVFIGSCQNKEFKIFKPFGSSKKKKKKILESNNFPID